MLLCILRAQKQITSSGINASAPFADTLFSEHGDFLCHKDSWDEVAMEAACAARCEQTILCTWCRGRMMLYIIDQL